MEAVNSLTSSAISKSVMKLSKNWICCPPKKIYCQTSGTKSGNLSSVVTERSSVISSETLGSLVLTPNTEMKVKDLVPYGQSRHDDGIGITMFLRGKAFLITGATGFLGKGTSSQHYHLLLFSFLAIFITSYPPPPVLIEKILRTAPDVNKIFILIKAKNKEVAMQRLKNEVFIH